MDDLALERQQDLRLGSSLELLIAQLLDLLLVNQDNIDPLLKLVDDLRLQILITWHQGLAMPAPGRVDVDDHQLPVALVEECQEMLLVLYCYCQLDFLWGHLF